MSSSGSTYGDIHRYEPARESTAAAIAIVLLTIIEVIFVFLFSYGLVPDGRPVSGHVDGPPIETNMFLGAVLAVIFVDLVVHHAAVPQGVPSRRDDRQETASEVGRPLHPRRRR